VNECKPLETGGKTIPRVIHFLWKTATLPRFAEAYKRSWLEHHSGWKIMQWTAGAYTRPLGLLARLEPFLTQKHTLNIPNTPYHPVNTSERTPNCTPCHTEVA